MCMLILHALAHPYIFSVCQLTKDYKAGAQRLQRKLSKSQSTAQRLSKELSTVQSLQVDQQVNIVQISSL